MAFRKLWAAVNSFIQVNKENIEIEHDPDGYIEVNGQRFAALTTAIEAGVTESALPEGSLVVTTNATGLGTIFRVDDSGVLQATGGGGGSIDGIAVSNDSVALSKFLSLPKQDVFLFETGQITVSKINDTSTVVVITDFDDTVLNELFVEEGTLNQGDVMLIVNGTPSDITVNPSSAANDGYSFWWANSGVVTSKTLAPDHAMLVQYDENGDPWWYVLFIVAAPGGGGGTGVVETIVAGDNVTVDDTDPANPVVAAVVDTNGVLTEVLDPAAAMLPTDTLILIQEDVLISGSGYAGINRQLQPFSVINGRTAYVYPGETDPTQEGAYWSGAQWLVVCAAGVQGYLSNDDVATPDLITTWLIFGGDSTYPTSAVPVRVARSVTKDQVNEAITNAGTENVIPKTDASGNLVDSKIKEPGPNSDIEINSLGGTCSIGDTNGDFNNTKVTVDDANQAIYLWGTTIGLANIPTSDPAINTALWNDGGTLRISAG